MEGLYLGQIVPCLHMSAPAANALRLGEEPHTVPTKVFGQECVVWWARDVVWDCASPLDCRPVVRSDRHTVFPGERQVDRAALRQVAADLAWHDTDIVQQVGEGGVEVRLSCPLETILAFHYRGVLDEPLAAAKVIAADLREGWVASPVQHLPLIHI